MMSDIRNLALVLLLVVVAAQLLFVIRFSMGRLWRNDFVGRALWFKSTAVLFKGVNELLLWWFVPQLIDMIPTALLISVVFSDIWLSLGCTWQYLALERQKREDRRDGTDMGAYESTSVPQSRWPSAVTAIAGVAIVFALVYASVHGARANTDLAATLKAERHDHAVERGRLLDQQEWLEGKYDALLAYADELGGPVPAQFGQVTKVLRNSREVTKERTHTRTESPTSRSEATPDRPTTPPATSAPPVVVPDVELPDPPEIPGVDIPSIPVPDLPIPN